MPRVETVEPDNTEKCASCGAKLQEGAKFCTTCGAAVNTQVELPEVAQTEVIETPVCDEPSVEPVSEITEEPTSRPNERVCVSCGAPLEADDSFCTQCGTKN